MDGDSKQGEGRRRANLRVVLIMAVIMAGIIGFGYLDQARYDAKVPLGTWYGSFSSHGGLRGAMFVVARRKHLAAQDNYMGKSNGVFFPGSAELCFAPHIRQYLTLAGSTDQSGPGFTFDLIPRHGPEAALRFVDGVHGVRHHNTLAMAGRLEAVTARRVLLPSSDITTGQTLFTLAKGNHRQFLESCKKLESRGRG